MKRHDCTAMVPVVLLTAQTDGKQCQTAAELGAPGYLTKLFDETRLLRVVDESVAV